MRTLNIEVFDKKVVRLQEKPNKDIEIIVSELQPDGLGNLFTGKSKGVFDSVIATIPSSRREIVSAFLKP
jgi:hypothetical protein